MFLPGDARMMLDQRKMLSNWKIFEQNMVLIEVLAQYFLYLNDVSLLSFHHINLDAYTHISKYQACPLFALGSYQIAFKFHFYEPLSKRQENL